MKNLLRLSLVVPLAACGGMGDAVDVPNRMFSDMELVSCDFRENRSDKDREECQQAAADAKR